MHVIRALVAAAVILMAMPAAAQDPVNPSTKSQGSNVPQVRVAGAGYYGGFGYGYGRYIYGYPFRPRVWWVVDEFVQEGRPLGFSPSAYGPNNYSAPQPSWGGWPYNTGGRDLAPPPAPSTPKAESDSALAEGRGLWKSGDYTGALACFKRAVASNLSNGSARLHMGLALLATGDLANADKAVASALVHLGGPDDVTAVNLEGSFRNPKERSKFESKLVPARDGSGTLSVALAQHLVGLKAKAAKLLADSKDPSAPKLAAVLR